MELLKQRIAAEGRVEANSILKVDNFLNHQIDVELFLAIGEEFRKRFPQARPDKILTIESSGIGVAFATAMAFGNLPVVFAKKKDGGFQNRNAYISKVFSYTKDKEYEIMVDKRFLLPGERVLVIDDFLANGNAALGLLSIVREADATLEGFGAVIEKGFQEGRHILLEQQVDVQSLVVIREFADNQVVFDHSL